jgi:hypothetical protein
MCHTSAHNVSFQEIVSYNSPEFNQLYKLYEQAFPLEDEREPPEAFEQILALNNDQRIQSLYGRYREVVTTIRLGQEGKVIGGVIFGITTSKAHIDSGIPASVQAIYVFLSSDYRGIIPMRAITDYCKKTALETFGRDYHLPMRDPLIFFEVNNPLRLTSEQVADDTLSSGICPFRRYVFWQRSIASSPLDFSYVQPRLREDAEPVYYLDLFCTNELPQGIPAQLLLNHLHSFVSISVLKGQDASQDSDFATMEQWLKRQDKVKLLPRNSQKLQEIAELRRQRINKN